MKTIMCKNTDGSLTQQGAPANVTRKRGANEAVIPRCCSGLSRRLSGKPLFTPSGSRFENIEVKFQASRTRSKQCEAEVLGWMIINGVPDLSFFFFLRKNASDPAEVAGR
jgi:hypothetical protein